MGCTQSKPVVGDDKDETDKNSLTVIVVHYNPFQFQRRAFLVNDCLSRLCDTQRELNNNNNKSSTSKKKKKKDVSPTKLHIVAVELSYDDRDPEIVPRDEIDLIHRRVSSHNIMWSKEQLINLAIRQLPQTRQYIAWIDSDIAIIDEQDSSTTNKNWVDQTIQTLSQHPKAFAQLFGTCDMLGPDGKAQVRVTSFAQQYKSGEEYQDVSNKHHDYWHPGFAWAATRKALNCTNGLIAKTLGSADRHMAMSFLGRAAETVPPGLHPSYLQQVLEWEQLVQSNCLELVVVPLKIVHFWHGSLKRRKYMERWDILKYTAFDWTVHLDYDENQDLYIWSDACPLGIVNLVNDYFQQRQEDSNIVDDDDDDGNMQQPAGEDSSSQQVGTALEDCGATAGIQDTLSSAITYITQFLPGGGSSSDAREKDDPLSSVDGAPPYDSTGGAGGWSNHHHHQVQSSDGPGPSSGCNDPPPTDYLSAFTGYA